MQNVYESFNHCFMHCYDCPDDDVDYSQTPFVVVIDNAKFVDLFPADPNDPDNPTTELCVIYNGCCYCDHFYVLMPTNVDGSLVTAGVTTTCEDCNLDQGYACEACPPPELCYAFPPLLETYEIQWSGDINCNGNIFHDDSPQDMIHYPFPGNNCSWVKTGYGFFQHEQIFLTLQTASEPHYWRIQFGLDLTWKYAVYIEARKYTGTTPVGTYLITYRRTASYSPLSICVDPVSNTINNVVLL